MTSFNPSLYLEQDQSSKPDYSFENLIRNCRDMDGHISQVVCKRRQEFEAFHLALWHPNLKPCTLQRRSCNPDRLLRRVSFYAEKYTPRFFIATTIVRFWGSSYIQMSQSRPPAANTEINVKLSLD